MPGSLATGLHGGATSATSSVGQPARSSRALISPPSAGKGHGEPLRQKSAGDKHAGCCATGPSLLRTVLWGSSSCSTRKGPPPSAASPLTASKPRKEGARLHLGARPVILPEPLAGLVAELVATRRGHAVLGDQGTSTWLFPGGQPGRPISAYRLTERLRQLGIYAGPARSSALFQLATELPAAVIARMLGVHIKVAVQWQRASSGDWTSYAADYSRRQK